MEQRTVTVKPNGIQMDIDRQEFALALKTYRLRQGKTQKEIAREWGMSRFTIIRAESAKPLSWEMAYRCFNRLSEALRKEANNG